MRLIDKDALIQKRDHAKAYAQDMYVIGQGYVMDAPTFDAVLVVRCKDCVNAKCIDEMEGVYTCTHPQWIRKTHKDTYEDGRLFHGLEANDFCSYGAKMEDKP